MPNILAKFIPSKMFKGIINSFGYISKGDQIVINEVQDKTDNKSGHIKALAAKIYFTYKKYIQQRNYDLELPDVKFKTIEKALRVESYLRRSKDRYIELIWKNGYDFIGKNKRAVNYIKRRFKEISYVTSKPTKLLFEEITEQLIPYYNSFILKVRNANSSSGNSRKYFGKVVQPVAGYFIVDINNLEKNIFAKAIIAHFTVALIQPFFDGNKRTARLLMNFILLQNNYPLLSLPVKIRKQYADAMISGYETLNIKPLIGLLSDSTLKKLKDYNL